MAALLPVIGFGVRWVAFEMAQVGGSASTLAAAAPISQLAATGFLAVAPSLFFAALSWWGFQSGTKSSNGPAAEPTSQSLPGWFLPLTLVVCVAVGAWVIFAAPGFPSNGLGALLGLSAGWLLGRGFRRSTGHWFVRALPVVAFLTLGTALANGIGGVLPGVGTGRYTMRQTAPLESGVYQQLGVEQGRVYLEPCAPKPRRTFGALDSDVTLVEPEPAHRHNRPSLIGIIFYGESTSFGLHRCAD